MKKLKLSLSNLDSTEVLSREQLKRVVGGQSGSGGCPEYRCVCGNDSWVQTFSSSTEMEKVMDGCDAPGDGCNETGTTMPEYNC